MLDAEQPDVVIFTGDVIYSAPADSGMLKVLEQVSNRTIASGSILVHHHDCQKSQRKGVYAVSYTHLDVYKRQSILSPSLDLAS